MRSPRTLRRASRLFATLRGEEKRATIHLPTTERFAAAGHNARRIATGEFYFGTEPRAISIRNDRLVVSLHVCTYVHTHRARAIKTSKRTNVSNGWLVTGREPTSWLLALHANNLHGLKLSPVNSRSAAESSVLFYSSLSRQPWNSDRSGERKIASPRLFSFPCRRRIDESRRLVAERDAVNNN